MDEEHTDLRRRRGKYGIDGSFDHAPPAVHVATIGAVVVGLAAAAVAGMARGRRTRGLVAGSAAATLAGGAVTYLHASRRGKFLVWADLLEGLRLKGDERLLDLGCGRGAVLMQAARLLPKGRAVGVDLWRSDQSGNSPEATRRNARLEGVEDRVETLTADVTKLPFPDRSFDVVVSNLVLHNLPGQAARTAAIDEAARVLRPGGRLLIADLGFTRSYADRLRELGLRDVQRRNLGWRMWYGAPWFPAHVVTAARPPAPVEAREPAAPARRRPARRTRP
jgi:arsenite methyltransferase